MDSFEHFNAAAWLRRPNVSVNPETWSLGCRGCLSLPHSPHSLPCVCVPAEISALWSVCKGPAALLCDVLRDTAQSDAFERSTSLWAPCRSHASLAKQLQTVQTNRGGQTRLRHQGGFTSFPLNIFSFLYSDLKLNPESLLGVALISIQDPGRPRACPPGVGSIRILLISWCTPLTRRVPWAGLQGRARMGTMGTSLFCIGSSIIEAQQSIP